MKKILLCFMICMTLIGCQSKSTTNEKQTYQKYLEKLKTNQKFETKTNDFRIKVVLNQLKNKQVRYDLIIDEPAIVMKNIKVLTMIDGQKDNDFPSLGIIDQNQYSLIPHQYDEKKNIYKGIHLSGLTKNKKITLKIYIYYENDQKVERYFKIDENAIR